MDELKFQARLIKETKDAGGWGVKMANRHIGGIPDVVLKSLAYKVPYFIECKRHGEKIAVNGRTLPVKLTGLQRETLRRMRGAGLMVGWMLLYEVGREKYIFAGADIEVKNITFEQPFRVDGRKNWPVDSLLGYIRDFQKNN